MKRALLWIVAACSAPDVVQRPTTPPFDEASLRPRPPPDAPSQSATDKERAIADKYLKSLSSPGSTGLGPLLADEVHFTFAGQVATGAYGRKDVIAAHEKQLGGFEPRDFAASRVLLTDQLQSIEWTMTGKDKASGKPIGMRGIALLTTKDDGTVSDIHLYYDKGVVQAEITGLPAELAKLPLPTPPAGARVEAEQGRTDEEAANVKVVSGALDALENNEAAYLGAMTDDIQVTTPQRATPMTGKKDLHAYFAMMAKTIARLDTQLDNAWGVGNFVVAEYHIVGEQRGKYLYVPKKDPLIKTGLVDVVEMRAGKIARITRYDDPLQILMP